MSKALMAGINQVATDKGLDREVIFDAIEAALVSAYKRNYGSVANVSAEVDRASGDMRVFAEKEVVDDVLNPRTEISLEDARQVNPDVKLGDLVRIESQPQSFGRIAAQTAKQVILQRIREAERDTVYENFVHKVGEIINAQVRSVDAGSGAVTVLVGDKHESLLPRDEQVPSEFLRRGDYIRLYVVDVHKSTRGPVIKLSRTHRNLLRRLMEQEIPEIREGTVEIKAIAREPGARSKVAVAATVPGIDPVGSCVGMRGMRIQNIVNELAGEKIDVVEWSTELRQYIANSLSPAKVTNVLLDDSSTIKTAVVIVPDRQLSLAIGKEGQNARLAAKLTSWRIDIKSESEARSEGLDRLAEEQAHLAVSSRGDLLAVAEQILRGGAASDAEERLRRAARAVQDSQDAQPDREESFESDKMVPFEAEVDTTAFESALEQKMAEEEQQREDSEEALDAFSRAAASVASSGQTVPQFEEQDDSDDVPAPADLAGEAMPAGSEPEQSLEQEGDSEIVEAGDLPEVITADMLRARMAQRRSGESGGGKIDLDEIEVPPELLVDLDDDEDPWDEGERKGKGQAKKAKGAQSKDAGKSAKGKKKPRRRREDEESLGGRW